MWDFQAEIGTMEKNLGSEIHQPDPKETRCIVLRSANEPHDRT